MRKARDMKAVKWLAIIVVGSGVLAAVAGMLMPSKVEISRSAVIAAPPQAIYPLIADFKTGWTRWNAFDDEDSGIAYSYAGPEMGLGAVQKWSSKKMGDGSMTITKADTAAGVDFDLLIGPGPFKLEGSLIMAPQGTGTQLTWTDRADMGKNPFKRLMGPIMSKMIGKSFEKSLSTIKQIAESAPAPVASAPEAAANAAAAEAAPEKTAAKH
jgi:hypothetical protein